MLQLIIVGSSGLLKYIIVHVVFSSVLPAVSCTELYDNCLLVLPVKTQWKKINK